MNIEQKLKQQINKIEQRIETIRSRKMITCPECKKRTAISKATIVEDYWYVRPSGCMGGDYWKFNEYWYCCSKCGKTSRAYITTWDIDRETKEIKTAVLKEPRIVLFNFIKEHLEHFGEVLKSYDDGNLTLDQLREKNKERKERENDRWL